MMEKNLSSTDRIIRAVLGLAILGIGFYFKSVWGLAGIVLIFTAGMGWCPAYAMLGMSTCGVKDKSSKA